MDTYIKAHTIGEAWLLAIKSVLAYGIKIEDDKGFILERIPLYIEITSPSINDKILATHQDHRYLEFLRKNFEEFTDIENWGYSYAQRLYSYNNTNQIDEVIQKLNSNPACKSATISLLKKDEDQNHTPCLIALDFKIRNENLIINGSFRSQDIGNKMYGDAIQLLRLGKEMIKHLRATTITLIHSIYSAHIYLTDVEKVKAIIASEK